MGTPIVDRARLARELADLLAKPRYKALLVREDRDLQMRYEKAQRRAALGKQQRTSTPYQPLDAIQFASDAVNAALGTVNQPNLIDPIEVIEMQPANASVCLFRLYDGISHATALTLGRWWCNRTLLSQIWNATSNLAGEIRQRQVREFLRTAMFVHPSWNHGTHIAQMKIPAGCCCPAIVGRGSWEAMRSARAAPKIDTVDDVIDKLGLMPIPGPRQFFVPVFNDMWVRGIPDLSDDWPLN